MKLHTIALGCQMSEADAAEMSLPLLKRGFSRAAVPDDADAVLISTCTVRDHAEHRAVSLIGSLKSWKDADPRRVLIVAGCAAERLGDSLRRRFPHVDLVAGAKSIESFPQLVERALGARFDGLAETRESFGEKASGESPSAVSSYLTIMRGCNYSCSYCIVPSVRGREQYRPAAKVLEEARAKADAGARELVLLGQTVNSYCSELAGRPLRFADLLRELDKTPGLERLRFMSPHPHYVDERMIAAMAECRTVCPQLHLPVQSGSDRILGLMKRNYSRASFLAKAALLRRRVPGIVLSTDIIVGFPTESEEDFKLTLSLVEELAPASAYCFKYSAREGTQSAALPDDVPREVKEERLARLNGLVGRLTAAALKAQVGRTLEVLCEERGFGRDRGGFKVKWDGTTEPGELVRIRITGAARRMLMGEADA
ncbi:MAG: tRNA (N6-isopentenyl adenosine(37)-C2)-methylthiotransferase MiaB [Elusimicrobia bacterium]|nr:tRNA (N6-isopentenyl adenosine(37)-C2)-methylthiotransferase MiaB [Elusimicrobiota bacterium]